MDRIDRVAGFAGTDRGGLWAVVGGLAAAVVVCVVPFLSFALSYLVILVHELGHALLGWIFGYPSIPAFDFTYGGGVAVHEERKLLLVVALYAAWIAGAWCARGRPRLLAAIAVGFVLWNLVAYTRCHRIAILLAGHGAELAIAGVFLHRAIGGWGTFHAAERGAYAMVAWFVVIRDTGFAWGLITDAHARRRYEDAKGGGHWMDFSRVAENHLGVDLAVVAGFFLAGCAVPVLAAWAWCRYRSRVHAALAWLMAGAAADD